MSHPDVSERPLSFVGIRFRMCGVWPAVDSPLLCEARLFMASAAWVRGGPAPVIKRRGAAIENPFHMFSPSVPLFLHFYLESRPGIFALRPGATSIPPDALGNPNAWALDLVTSLREHVRFILSIERPDQKHASAARHGAIFYSLVFLLGFSRMGPFFGGKPLPHPGH
jgi:hypothetical protein